MANGTSTTKEGPPIAKPTDTGFLTLAIVLIVGLVVGFGVGRLIGPGPSPQPTPQPSPVITIASISPTPVPPPPPACTPGTPGNYELYVDVDPANDNKPCKVVDKNGNSVPIAYISRRAGNTITFRPKDPNKKLEIIIHVPPGSPPLFENLAPHTYDPQNRVIAYRVYCNDLANDKPCFTGHALPAANPNPGPDYCLDFKYDQNLNGIVCDAHIIIQP